MFDEYMDPKYCEEYLRKHFVESGLMPEDSNQNVYDVPCVNATLPEAEAAEAALKEAEAAEAALKDAKAAEAALKAAAEKAEEAKTAKAAEEAEEAEAYETDNNPWGRRGPITKEELAKDTTDASTVKFIRVNSPL